MLATTYVCAYSFVLAQAVAACYAVAVGVVVLRRVNFAGERGSMEGFPVWRLAGMAVLDMLHLVPMIVAAADVAPTLTVLLLQCSAPFCLAVSGLFCSRCVDCCVLVCPVSRVVAPCVCVCRSVCLSLPVSSLSLCLSLSRALSPTIFRVHISLETRRAVLIFLGPILREHTTWGRTYDTAHGAKGRKGMGWVRSVYYGVYVVDVVRYLL